MTCLPSPAERGKKRLALLVDLDVCVGCHACAVNCKEWNTGGFPAPLSDQEPYGRRPSGAWLNRVHSFEAGEGAASRTTHFPKNCFHCEDAPCVPVCPTGASYKRAEDGIVLVNEDLCIGCGLCAWACPYGAREMDADQGVMKKCTLCIDRIYNENMEEIDRVPACVSTCPTGARHFGDYGDPDSDVSRLVRERGGFTLMPGMAQPTAHYLPPRPRKACGGDTGAPEALQPVAEGGSGFLAWVDRMLSR